MRVSGLTADGDWRFGKGRASYLDRSEAIRQNVVTRLRSFTEDWFLDTTAGLPWYDLLGRNDAQTRMLRDIERIILTTEGVRTIDLLEVVSIVDRDASIRITLTDIFNTEYTDTIPVTL